MQAGVQRTTPSHVAAASSQACQLCVPAPLPAQAMQQLVLVHALRALSDCRRTADVGAGSTEDVVERAAGALRVLFRWLGRGAGQKRWLAQLLCNLYAVFQLQRLTGSQGAMAAHSLPPGCCLSSLERP